MPKVFNISAEVHKPIGAGYRVKVFMHDLGMYINGMMVFPPDDEHDWSVYPPAQRAGRGKYAYLVEFNKKMPLWDEVHEACLYAVKLAKRDEVDDGLYTAITEPIKRDEVIEDIPDEPINLDDIPF